MRGAEDRRAVKWPSWRLACSTIARAASGSLLLRPPLPRSPPMAKIANRPEKAIHAYPPPKPRTALAACVPRPKRRTGVRRKAGQVDTVILSAEHYQALQANQNKARRAMRKGL